MHERVDRAWMEVDLDAVVRNAQTARKRAGVPVIAMIKADAYGLGAERVALALEVLDPLAYGIATVAEGSELRAAGIRRPLIVFTPLLRDEYRTAHELSLTPGLGSVDEINEWTREPGPWQLSIDTGMSRAGVQWRDIGALRDVLVNHPPEGVYGAGSDAGPELDPDPVIHVRARIVETRWIEPGDSVSYDATYHASSRRRIATIPMGYADGYPRALSNRSSVLTADGSVPITGVVTMDMIMLDVTDSACDVGDVVTLIGAADGVGKIGVAQLAALAGMSYYELLTGLRGRLDRYYSGG